MKGLQQVPTLPRTVLDDVSWENLHGRVLLAQALLSHRADDPTVLLELLRRVLAGETLAALSSEQVRG